MEQTLELLQKQKQILTQKQIQSLKILAMDNVELDCFLRQEYLDNPMLEINGQSPETVYESLPVLPSEDDKKWNHQMEESKDLKEYLRSQLNIGNNDETYESLQKYLIECLDDSGYFTLSTKEVAGYFHTSEETVTNCLDELKLLEPVGVFSSDLKECLLRQLEALGSEDPLLKQMIKEHLEDVAHGNIGHISRSLKIPTSQVRKYLLMIGTLNPRPSTGFGIKKTEYIVPDIIIKKEEDWEIQLNDGWMGNYQINDYYQNMILKTKDNELRAYFREKASRATFILQNVEQRRKTLMNVTQFLLDQQLPYFEGTGPLHPMTMAEAAQALGIHPSTVSRAVKGKYIQYPKETVPMKNLFSQSVSGISGSTTRNAKEIQEMIRRRISEENKRSPYSDQKLKELLEGDGIFLSRRAVAKYRELMGIKSSFNRKES